MMMRRPPGLESDGAKHGRKPVYERQLSIQQIFQILGSIRFRMMLI